MKPVEPQPIWLGSTMRAVTPPVAASKPVKTEILLEKCETALLACYPKRITPELLATCWSRTLLRGALQEQATGYETEPANSLARGHDVVSQHSQLADQACCISMVARPLRANGRAIG